jgi:hypothetical protein
MQMKTIKMARNANQLLVAESCLYGESLSYGIDVKPTVLVGHLGSRECNWLLDRPCDGGC